MAKINFGHELVSSGAIKDSMPAAPCPLVFVGRLSRDNLPRFVSLCSHLVRVEFVIKLDKGFHCDDDDDDGDDDDDVGLKMMTRF